MSVKVYSVRNIYVCVILVGYISSSCCINAGLIAELKRLNPMTIKKYSQSSPMYINIKAEDQHVTGELIHKLQRKPLNMKSMKLTKRFTRSIWPVPKLPLVPYALPLIPHSPFLPMFPNWLPKPRRSALSINTSPLLKLSHLLGWGKRNIQIHEKLLELKRKGTLTTAQYVRIQNLLLSL